LLNLACYFLDRQVERLAQDFESEGGFTERLSPGANCQTEKQSMKQTSETAFETAIEAFSLRDGYRKLFSDGFETERAIFRAELPGLIRDTQAPV
jgi:hypothetical protein